MRYVNYNDYELIYLISEGSEASLNILFNKYSNLITLQIRKYCSYCSKTEDLLQEGLMMLNVCIRTYNPLFKISFFSYFSILCRRRLSALMKESYYKSNLIFMEESALPYQGGTSKEHRFLLNPQHIFEDEILALLYKEHLIEGCSLRYFAQKHGLERKAVYYYKQQIVVHLKKILTNL